MNALGFAGKLGAPRSETSKAVAEHLGLPRASFGEYMRDYAGKRGLPVTREVLQEIGDDLVKKDAELLCDKVLSRADWTKGSPIVIDSIRHDEVLPVLESRLAPIPFGFICVDLEWDVQQKRWDKNKEAEQRDLPFHKTLEELQTHDAEIDIITSFIQKADLVVDGSKPIKDLVALIIKFSEKWKPAGNESWRSRNSRRIKLIKLKNRDGLAPEDSRELEILQKEFFAHLEKVHPSPGALKNLDAIEARLRGEKAVSRD
jgi:hypothetical protein